MNRGVLSWRRMNPSLSTAHPIYIHGRLKPEWAPCRNGVTCFCLLWIAQMSRTEVIHLNLWRGKCSYIASSCLLSFKQLSEWGEDERVTPHLDSPITCKHLKHQRHLKPVPEARWGFKHSGLKCLWHRIDDHHISNWNTATHLHMETMNWRRSRPNVQQVGGYILRRGCHIDTGFLRVASIWFQWVIPIPLASGPMITWPRFSPRPSSVASATVTLRESSCRRHNMVEWTSLSCFWKTSKRVCGFFCRLRCH